MPENIEEKEPFTFSYLFYVGLFFLMTWVNIFPAALFGYWFFLTFPFQLSFPYLLMMIPLFFILYGIVLLASLLDTKIGCFIVHKRITYPILGSSVMSLDDPQTRAFVLKGNIKGFGRWAFYFFHLKFLRAFWMRRMGVKLGKNVTWGMYVQDEEFIEIGDNTLMAWNTILSGHLMDQHDLTVNKTIVGKNCIFEPLSGSVGGTIGDNSIFKLATGVMKGQMCRGNAIYHGFPCKKVGNLSDLSPTDIEEIKANIRKYNKINYIKETNAPIKISEIRLLLMKFTVILGGSMLGLTSSYLYALIFQNFYSPTNQFLNILLLILVPTVFLISIGFFIVGSALIIKIFLIYYDRKGDIPEGTYELDDPRAKWFKIKYLLRMFGLRLFHGTPFKITDTFALRFWGKVKLGKNVKFDDAIVDPQYLEVGDYSQIAAGARVHTHYIIDNKLYVKTVKIGKNVMVGTYSHLKPGVEIADGSVCGVAVWFPENSQYTRPALFIGKPAAELPLSMLTKSARLEGKYID
ncbi:MAG: hypothetical protein LUQ65_12155 [Candidatus Helarchaeota archaeon]|nr:hypothetical protein [Candidatus Helarchaeota archaeon]